MSSILVVNDEKSLRDFLEIMLEEEGYKVFTAYNTYSAVKLIKENIFDLILTDIRMGSMSLKALKKSLLIHPWFDDFIC
jgi:two-component system response regulator PilR (NtrC family)